MKVFATYRRRRFFKKGAKRSFARRVHAIKTVARTSISPRAFHMPLPNNLRLRLRCVDQTSINTVGGIQDAFYYPLYFPGLWKSATGLPQFPAGFLNLMMMYSKAYVRNVTMNTRIMAVVSQANSTANVYTMITSEKEAIALDSLATGQQFLDWGNTTLARKHFLGPASGANNYVNEFRSCDLRKYTAMGSLLDNAVIREGTAVIQYTAPVIVDINYSTFSTPSPAEATSLPCYSVVLKFPLGGSAATTNFEFVFDFDIEFMELTRQPQVTSGYLYPVHTRRS